MKKPLYLIFAVLVAALGYNLVSARLTGTDPGTDIFCVGPSGAEICVDASGNLIPTTDSDTTVGTSSLRFATVYADTVDAGTTLTMPDSTVTTAKLASDAVTTAKLLGGTGLTTSNAALCLKTDGTFGQCSGADASACTCQ